MYIGTARRKISRSKPDLVFGQSLSQIDPERKVAADAGQRRYVLAVVTG